MKILKFGSLSLKDSAIVISSVLKPSFDLLPNSLVGMVIDASTG